MQVASLLIVLFMAGPSPDAPRYLLDSASRVRVSGDSTLHTWEAVSAKLDGRVIWEVKDNDSLMTSVDKAVMAAPSFEARLKVASLKSGKAGLDSNLYKALNYENFPEISFKKVTLKRTECDDRFCRVRIKGLLSLAGRERWVTTVGIFRSTGSALMLNTRFGVKMTDFDVEPPSVFFGAIQAHDDVELSVDLIFKMAPLGAAS